METTAVKNDKTTELVVYVASLLKDEPTYGATLLNKALYFIDIVNYLNHKKPISNLNYVKQENGPTPKPNQFLPIKNTLILNGEAEEKKVDFFGRVQKRFIPTRQPNLNFFEKEEIALIDNVVKTIATHTATSISDLTHGMLAWKVADSMEDIPLYTVLLTAAAPSEQDIAWATEKASKYLD